jgi:SAM-dependent methyltransferase
LHSAARDDPRLAWERLSAAYQAHHAFSTADVQYGAWSPPERTLNLLGDVRNRQVLDVGCGGGQNCIALARQGAAVTGLDFSREQLAFAAQLASASPAADGATPVQFVLGTAEELDGVHAGAFELVLSVNTLQYVAEIAACLAACRRVLRPRGRLVFSLDHPLRSLFWETGSGPGDEELSIVPARSYFTAQPLRWHWRSSGVVLTTYHRTIGAWTDLLAEADLRLLRIVEPPPPAATLDAEFPLDDALAPLRNVPHALIFVAQKP